MMPNAIDEPLRVLHIVGGLGPGGIESFLMSVYRQIDRTKVQFDFMVPEEREYHYSREVIDLGGNIYAVPYGKKDFVESNRRLRDFYLNHQYSVVHLHDGSLHSLQALGEAKSAGVPIRILHAHSSGSTLESLRDYADRLVHCFNSTRIGVATDFFACSRAAAEYFGFTRRKCAHNWRLILNGIDLDGFAFKGETRRRIRKLLEIDANALVVGTVGRMEREKNQKILIRALPFLKEHVDDVKFLLVGSGSLAADLRDTAESLGVAESCIFLSKRRDVNELCSAMDVFAFPSMYEGLGIALIEAEANGLPCVVSSNVPEEAVVTSNCSIEGVSEGGDPRQWANAILDAARRGRSADSQNQVEAAGFSIKETARWLEQFYIDSCVKSTDRR